jgi:uncharacterized protein (TIGR02453 family)
MSGRGLKISFFEFFIALAANNRKSWFDEHRAEYENDVKKPFENLVAELLQAFAELEGISIGIKPGDCIFRINRDIRFAKDKTPYKLNRSAIISAEGKKSLGPEGFYFEVGPEECAFYAGYYMPDKTQLAAIRQAIANEPERWLAITQNPGFVKTFGVVLGKQQKRLPPEFRQQADQLPILYNTQFYVEHKMEPEIFIDEDPVKQLISLWNTAKPWVNFLYDATSAKV